jgi:hypothetical protein
VTEIARLHVSETIEGFNFDFYLFNTVHILNDGQKIPHQRSRELFTAEKIKISKKYKKQKTKYRCCWECNSYFKYVFIYMANTQHNSKGNTFVASYFDFG